MAEASTLVTFGETMGLFIGARPGRFGVDRSFGFSVGGAESNVAIGAARLGATVTWFGRVGTDATGDFIKRLLAAEGIRTLAIDDPGFTGLMIKHERVADHAQVDYHRTGSAGARLTPRDIPVQAVRTADLLHITGITPALSSSARATVFEAVEIAKDADASVSFDLNYRRKLWAPDEAAPVLKDLAHRCDVVFAGCEEADLVTGQISTGASDAAAQLSSFGVREVVIKDGPRGCCALVDGTVHRLPAIPARVVDPVGAGDAFVSGYLADRLLGADVGRRLMTALRAGSYAVSVPGDCENLPSRTELERVGGPDTTR